MREIFTFGSNLAGYHGGGSAAHAIKYWGAKWEVGHGYYGDSYAIPTKDESIDTLPLEKILLYVNIFMDFARNRPDLQFNVVAIGCGLAGYNPKEIAPMFRSPPKNCILPKEFVEVLNEAKS